MGRDGGADDGSDEDLLRLAAAGDAGAFARLVRRHRRLLDAACATACPDRLDREDALQQALIDIWRGSSSFQGDARATTWMFRVAQNAARRHRTRALRSVPTDADADADAVASRGAEWGDALVTRSSVVAAIESLPQDHRDALLLHTQAGLPLEEIARIKYAAVGTVKSWIHRARAEVTRALAEAER